ncbi:UPF0764 protein C16orf89 [Nymphon striatum]|nr:UPF0764 protein C16orf89 [Nymphon striatum]
MDFFMNIQEELIADAILGVAVLKSEIESIKDDSKVDFSKLNFGDMQTLDEIWKNCNVLLKKDLVFVVYKESEFGENIEDDLEMCLQEIFKCKVTTKCWYLMEAPGYSGYILTHQVLYFALGIINNCQSEISKMEQSIGRETSKDIVRNLCGKIDKEMELMVRQNFHDENSQDLFLEQLAVCGINKIYNDKECTSLEKLFSWQAPNGCFSIKKNRVKRDDWIITAPAHSIVTLNTVVQRVLHIAMTLRQRYTVFTVNQALFPQLMELKWAKYKDTLIPRLGGLHISMNFLKVLGQHTADSGLDDVWKESALLGPISTEKIMMGKSYAKGVRAHKLTWQALWQLLLPQFISFLEEKTLELQKRILDMIQEANLKEDQKFDTLVSTLSSPEFTDLAAFVKGKEEDSNFMYLWCYMEMVSILMRFVRPQRDGLWELHLSAFREMLPYFYRYDHTNYARWGKIAMQDSVIESAVQSGGPDHSQEWLNCIGKKEGGIVGITKTTSALDASLSDGLINIATKDVTTSTIQDSLLNAGRLGQDKLEVFVKERLIKSTVPLRDTLSKSKALTFSSLYNVKESTQKAKDATLKADRNILQRLITAYQAGRKVDLDMVLQHELLNVPISLAQTNRALRTGNKAILVDVMTKDIVCPPQVVLDGSSCLVVDGQAAVVALGKPENVDNFGQFGDAFVKHISDAGQHFNRYLTNGKTLLALPANKEDLAAFLSNELITNAPAGKTLVVAGGFRDEEEVQTSNPNLDVKTLRARHEEADTRVILHCVHADADTVVVAARDTGCDTVSYLFGHSKKAAWEVFLTDNTLLSCLRIGELTPRVLKDAETFIGKVYSVHRITSCDKARVTLFCKCKSQESLPPTSDAVTYHIQRAHYQSMIWRQATSQQPHFPSATTLGWELTDEKLRPKLMSLPPIPVACKDIIRCGCKTGSSSGRCSCRAGKLKCTGACACANSGNVCMNK